MVNFFVEEETGHRNPIEVPTDMALNLMEVLKASDYPVLATCGGMALCATCHVEVLEGNHHEKVTDIELDILDTLPSASEHSRLSCQMQVTDDLEGLVLKLACGE